MIGNNPKNEKIEAKKEKKIKSLEEKDEPPDNRKCILDIEAESSFPSHGRIICIGILETDTKVIRIFFDHDEKVMLTRFIRFFDTANFSEIVAFNATYDLRYLLARCLKFRLKAAKIFSTPCNDIMITLKKVNKNMESFNRPGSLQDWSVFIFGQGKMQKSASISTLYHQSKISEILRYNKTDLELTHQLWMRLNLVIGLKNNMKNRYYSQSTQGKNRENIDLCLNFPLKEKIEQQYQHTLTTIEKKCENTCNTK